MAAKKTVRSKSQMPEPPMPEPTPTPPMPPGPSSGLYDHHGATALAFLLLITLVVLVAVSTGLSIVNTIGLTKIKADVAAQGKAAIEAKTETKTEGQAKVETPTERVLATAVDGSFTVRGTGACAGTFAANAWKQATKFEGAKYTLSRSINAAGSAAVTSDLGSVEVMTAAQFATAGAGLPIAFKTADKVILASLNQLEDCSIRVSAN